MDAQQAGALFKQADALYQQGRHAEALTILGQLNEAFPNQKNVLWPTALSLNKLGRSEEAARICDYLVAYYGHTQADELRQVIAMHLRDKANSQPPDATGGLNLNDIDAMLDRPAPAARPRVAAGPDYKKYGLIGGGVLVALLLVVLPFIGGGSVRPPVAASGGENSKYVTEAEFQEIIARDENWDKLSPSGQQQFHDSIVREDGLSSASDAAPPTGFFIGILLGFFVVIVLTTAASMYIIFSILGKLPSNDFSENAADVTLYALFFVLLCFIPILGFILAIIMLSNHYKLSCGELFVSVVMINVVASIIMWGLGLVLGTSMAAIVGVG